MLAVFVIALALLFEPVLAVRQYVEIERRHSLNANSPAKTFVTVFGFVATFLSIIVIILFAWPHIKMASLQKTKIVQVSNQTFAAKPIGQLMETEFSFAPNDEFLF